MTTAQMTAQPLADVAAELERLRDELVRRAEEFFMARRQLAQQDYRIRVIPIERSQRENVLRMALNTPSVREVIAFIRYQMSRHEEWNEGNLGRALIDAVERVERAAGNAPSIEVVRRFLGYITRAAVYEERQQEELKEISSAFFDERGRRSRHNRSIEVVPLDVTILEGLSQQACQATSLNEVIRQLQGQIQSNEAWHNGNFGQDLLENLQKAAEPGWNDSEKKERACLFLGAVVREAEKRRRRG